MPVIARKAKVVDFDIFQTNTITFGLNFHSSIVGDTLIAQWGKGTASGSWTITTIDAAAGTVSISLSSVQTSAIEPGAYKWHLTLIRSGRTITLIKGTMNVEALL